MKTNKRENFAKSTRFVIVNYSRVKRGQINQSLKKAIYDFALGVLYPLNYLLMLIMKRRALKKSVLHISFLVHVPYYTVVALRKAGLKADYLAIGSGGVTWKKSDFQFIPLTPYLRAFQEFLFVWKVLAKYEVIHSHFMVSLSESGWELRFLKRMGRKLVVHYRGCEIRDRARNAHLSREYNICQECDYPGYCVSDGVMIKRKLARKYGDAFLVTTPDLKEVFPEAIHVPFVAPEIPLKVKAESPKMRRDSTTILHVTNHPGIEGTREIERVIGNLRNIGYKVSLVVLKGVPHERVLRELSSADMSIGKMKMGYYANFQIESMLMGVPAITYVRPEYRNEELEKSGFIFTDLNGLEETIKDYLDNPWKLEQKKRIARDSILKLHDNKEIAKQYISVYDRVKSLPNQ